MKILHIDIETAPNVAHVWGLWQQNVGLAQLLESGYTLCSAAKWDGEDEVFAASLYHDGEASMLAHMHDLLSQADAVVHYNGKKFDIPTLNKKFIKTGLLPPDPYHQIDLLEVAKKRFRFASNKLDHIAGELGLGNKTNHVGHEMWVGCMNDDPDMWKMMIEYNEQDVLLLEALYHKMMPWIQNHPNHALYCNPDSPVCPNCGSDDIVKKGIETTKLMQYQRYRCKDCGTPLRGRTSEMDTEARRNVLTQSKI